MSRQLWNALGASVPFAAVEKANGQCLHMGRSLRKICEVRDDKPHLFDHMSLRKPLSLKGRRDLATAFGKRVVFQLNRMVNDSPVLLRAVVAQLDTKGRYFFVNMSLEADMPKLVEPLDLSDQDFSASDPSVDLLYVVQTQSALLADAQRLAERLKAANEKAIAQSLSDPLTELPNRRALTKRIEDFSSRKDRDPAYLLQIDLDRFKQVNDRLGHAAGDAVLLRVASDLRDIASEDGRDIVARVGGDEFVAFITSQPDLESTVNLADWLITRISTPLPVNGQVAEVGASIGISILRPGEEKSIDTLLLEADLALYDVKNDRRGAAKVFNSEIAHRESRTQDLIRDIEAAIQNGEFVPFYQVQIDAISGQVFGCEALGRWQHPTLGIIKPHEFLYVAERSNLTDRIDQSIYATALDDFAAWKRLGIAPPFISLNMTAKKLTTPDLADWLVDLVTSRGISPSEVHFELIETILLDGKSDDTRKAANTLVEAGFHLAIDDFGTGRAALTSLTSVPVSLVKIDRAFVTDLHEKPKLRLLTQAIIDIAHGLDLQVLAEGTETRVECRTLIEMGCTVFQGFFWGHPVPSATFAEMLSDRMWTERVKQIDLALSA